ncbi:MAG: tripartite tricarboxylate transporter substrate binding protein [Burkholderiales bacterium]|nr:tripartite tricarboxylate transporter substrate binding protein [Burkholderiales bacterium]
MKVIPDSRLPRAWVLAIRGIVVAVLSPLPGAVAAQPAPGAFPVRPIRLVVPYTPGASNDIFARALAQRLTGRFGVNVIVDNRAGAGGHVGGELVARAAPDGHTLILATNGLIAISPHVFRKLNYDPQRDLVPVTLIASIPYVLAVPSALAARDAREFIALARAKSGQLTYASSGNGSTPHLCGEMLKMLAGIDMVHVPYRGGGPAVIDLAGGRVQMYCASIATMRPGLQSGKIRLIAVTTQRRTPLMPDLPTASEQGVRDLEVSSWAAIMTPAGSPHTVIERLNAEIASAMATEDMRKFILGHGAEPLAVGPAEFARHIKTESARWGKVARVAAIRVD